MTMASRTALQSPDTETELLTFDTIIPCESPINFEARHRQISHQLRSKQHTATRKSRWLPVPRDSGYDTVRNDTMMFDASHQAHAPKQGSFRPKTGVHLPSDEFEVVVPMMKQPESSPISPDQLAAEVKGIYSGLVMVEAKCINIDAAQAVEPKSQLTKDQWQALIALHRTLLYEHHDFLTATQHPTATSALKGLAIKYSMPARMWKHGIHAFLEVLRHRRPESQEYMLAFIYLAYQMMALMFETVPAFTDTWIECLGDLARYKMAVEDNTEIYAAWTSVATRWYTMAADRNLSVSRLYHHLGILERPSLRKLSFYLKSMTCVVPSTNARDSLATLYRPTVQDTLSESIQPLEACIVAFWSVVCCSKPYLVSRETTEKEFDFYRWSTPQCEWHMGTWLVRLETFRYQYQSNSRQHEDLLERNEPEKRFVTGESTDESHPTLNRPSVLPVQVTDSEWNRHATIRKNKERDRLDEISCGDQQVHELDLSKHNRIHYMIWRLEARGSSLTRFIPKIPSKLRYAILLHCTMFSSATATHTEPQPSSVSGSPQTVPDSAAEWLLLDFKTAFLCSSFIVLGGCCVALYTYMTRIPSRTPRWSALLAFVSSLVLYIISTTEPDDPMIMIGTALWVGFLSRVVQLNYHGTPRPYRLGFLWALILFGSAACILISIVEKALPHDSDVTPRSPFDYAAMRLGPLVFTIAAIAPRTLFYEIPRWLSQTQGSSSDQQIRQDHPSGTDSSRDDLHLQSISASRTRSPRSVATQLQELRGLEEGLAQRI